jgi:DNA repair protein RecN (Recombination protein N)
MLIHLSLKDFAVVSAAELSFGPGMTVVSGETGAGKSLLVDALMWLTGARAESGIVRHGAERAELAAEFSLDDAPQALAWLRETELDDENTCQLRRVIRADGGSKAWINGRTATLSQLSELGSFLVEIHGQHEHQALLDKPQQLQLLDAFAQHADVIAPVQHHANTWHALQKKIDALSQTGDVSNRIQYLEHQLKELMDENLDAESLEQLQQQHRRQTHSASLLQGFDLALARLQGDDGFALSNTVRQLSNHLQKLAEHEPRLGDIHALLETAEIQLDEAANQLERLRDELELDPQSLQLMEQRLTRMHELGRKHRLPLNDLAKKRDDLEAECEQLRDKDAALLKLNEDQKLSFTHYQHAAEKLSQSREKSAQTLSKIVSSLMNELGMNGGQFTMELERSTIEKPNILGAERVEFLVSANPGQPPRALRKVASGGELARISLAIEVAALGLDSVPTMIFDEVDSGIGGAVAEVVGKKLRALGAERQVMCVTHLPQVASQGHQHIQVSKAVQDGSTHSQVQALDDKNRIEEIARMLGGVEITKETRANAKQMLRQAQANESRF